MWLRRGVYRQAPFGDFLFAGFGLLCASGHTYTHNTLTFRISAWEVFFQKLIISFYVIYYYYYYFLIELLLSSGGWVKILPRMYQIN